MQRDVSKVWESRVRGSKALSFFPLADPLLILPSPSFLSTKKPTQTNKTYLILCAMRRSNSCGAGSSKSTHNCLAHCSGVREESRGSIENESIKWMPPKSMSIRMGTSVGME